MPLSAEEYELLPHEELQKLREEVEELKRNPMGNVQESEDLKTAMAKLTKAMHHLIDILTRTNDEMVSEFKRTTMSQHFEKISDQNEKIAQALLGFMHLQEQTHQQSVSMMQQEGSPGSRQNDFSQESFSSQDNSFQDQTMTPPSESPMDIPPPEHKKKGLGLFK
ncbi:MAG: hypothetical protein KC535_04210 [Nanoarchaeota archaeon]|nr:hypothetical protein [Nanoarchaeota archaeon]